MDVLFVEHQDAGFSGVWGFKVTSPTSSPFVTPPGPLPWVGVALGAVLQAVALGAAYRWLTSRSQHHGSTSTT